MNTTNDDSVTLRLLDWEAANLQLLGSITTATFYQGEPPLGHIRARLEEIFEKNPWIQGRLLLDSKKTLTLKYPRVPAGVDGFLKVVTIPTLCFDMDFPGFATAMTDALIKGAHRCVNKEEDLFRLTVVNISPGRFALVMSMSHAYADGLTYYGLFRMLSTTEPVRALIADRVHTSRTDMNAAIRGGGDAFPWMTSPGFIMNAASTFLRKLPSTWGLFKVNQQRVDARKKEYQAQNAPKFISSNDVITSAFFCNTPCDLPFLTADFRDRIPHLTMNHAGNYEGLIAYQREDFARPDLIRGSLADFRRRISGKLPGFFRSLRVKVGAVTNWTTYYKDVMLPDCRLEFHRPYVNPSRPLPFEHMVIIFKSRQDQLSLITRCRDTSVLSGLEILEAQVV